MNISAGSNHLDEMARELQEFGRRSRARAGAGDVRRLKQLVVLSKATEVVGRAALHFAAGPWSWFAGVVSLAFHLSMESQFMHSVMHGAYVGLPGAGRYTPKRFETIAVPLQTKTWGQCHAIHHAKPSLLGQDPDTLHPLYRVHEKTTWRPLHFFNTFLGPLFVFEELVFNYDRLLKSLGLREKNDRSELRKFLCFIAYQYIFWPLLAGPNWKWVLAGNFSAVLLRNLGTTSLQMASSVGHEVSNRHFEAFGRKSPGETVRFQVETSKNFVAFNSWRPFMGGLDRHIEHHLYPSLPPSRLHDYTGEIRDLCREHGVQYDDYPSFTASLKDSLSYLHSLSRSPRHSARPPMSNQPTNL